MVRHEELPRAARLKLDFLWRASQEALASRPPQPRVAQKLVADLRRAAARDEFPLPGELLRAICPACSVPRLAGVTCRTRTVRRTRRSPDALRWASRKPLKAQLVTTCLLCGDVRRAPAGHRVPAPNKTPAGPVTGDFVAMPAAAPPEAAAPAPRLLLDSKPRKRKKGGGDGAGPAEKKRGSKDR